MARVGSLEPGEQNDVNDAIDWLTYYSISPRHTKEAGQPLINVSDAYSRFMLSGMKIIYQLL